MNDFGKLFDGVTIPPLWLLVIGAVAGAFLVMRFPVIQDWLKKVPLFNGDGSSTVTLSQESVQAIADAVNKK